MDGIDCGMAIFSTCWPSVVRHSPRNHPTQVESVRTTFAAEIRRKHVDSMRGHAHWRWHRDEIYVKINGEMHYQWRAVDHDGEVLESSAREPRDKAAAPKFIKNAMRRTASPE